MMNVNAEPLISLLIQLLLLLTMVSSFSYHPLPIKTAFHHQASASHHQPASSQHLGNASSTANSRVGKALSFFNLFTSHASRSASGLHPGHTTDTATSHTGHAQNTAYHHLGHAPSPANSRVGKALSFFNSFTSHVSSSASGLHPGHTTDTATSHSGHAHNTANHHLGHASSPANSHTSHASSAANGSHPGGHASATSNHHLGQASSSASSQTDRASGSSTSSHALHAGHSTSTKPAVMEREQAILGVYQTTIAHVTQTSAKITELSRHILNHSLDIVATNVLRYDQYITDVDERTRDCKFNSEEQLQRVKDLLQQKLKHKISQCMAHVNSRLGTSEKLIRDELNKYNNVMLLQIKNILVICNKMQADVMTLCLDKSWQISAHVNEKFLASVNGHLGHALLVYNQSNGTLMECLQKDIQANKKFFHWAIKLYRTSSCKHLLKP